MAKARLRSAEPESVTSSSQVWVTPSRAPDRRGFWERVSGGSRTPLHRVVAVVLLAMAIAGVLLAAALGFVGRGGPREALWGVRDPGPAGVAAAFGYPTGCLRVTFSAGNSGFARADFGHSRSCGYDSGFPSALFHRFNGEWHPVLYAVSYSCPVASIPPPLQRQLSLC